MRLKLMHSIPFALQFHPIKAKMGFQILEEYYGRQPNFLCFNSKLWSWQLSSIDIHLAFGLKS